MVTVSGMREGQEKENKFCCVDALGFGNMSWE